MKITRSLISATSALAIFAGSAAPALAYVRSEPPIATTTLRQRAEVRELYADAFSSILELGTNTRGVAEADLTGRSNLARAQVRAAQRNYRRHVLGYLRGVDYRVLNTSGDMRRTRTNTVVSLPLSLVTTGRGGSDESFGSWMWDRPTRRDIRENMYNVDDRKRDILKEMENNGR